MWSLEESFSFDVPCHVEQDKDGYGQANRSHHGNDGCDIHEEGQEGEGHHGRTEAGYPLSESCKEHDQACGDIDSHE